MLLVADTHQSWKKNKPSKAKKRQKTAKQNKRKTRGKQEGKRFCCGVRSRSEILPGGKRGKGGEFCYPGNAKGFTWSVTRMW